MRYQRYEVGGAASVAIARAWYSIREDAYGHGMTQPGQKSLSIKDKIGRVTGMSDKLLHVHAGIAIFLISAAVLGRPLSDPLPLLVVAVAEIANEIRDRVLNGSWRWRDTLGDIANTLFWPLCIFGLLQLP